MQGANTITKIGNTFHVLDGGAGADQFVATTSSIVAYFGATAGVTVNLGTGSASGGLVSTRGAQTSSAACKDRN